VTLPDSSNISNPENPQPTEAAQPSSDAPLDAQAEAAAPANPPQKTTARWIIAAAASLGVAVITVASLTGRPKSVVLEETPPSAAADKATPVCKAESQANLDFTVKDMHGANVRLADYKGKVILFNFWATWCPPCRAELPGIIELYDQYKDKGLVILGVSGDDDAPTLRAFADEWKIRYPMIVGRDETALFDAYGPIYGYPISVLIGRDGAVCARHIGPATKEEFEREIKALL
jgi:peroxiredoxin